MLDLVIRIIADGLVVFIVLIGGFAYFMNVTNDRFQAYSRAFMAGLSAFVTAKVFSFFYQTIERPFVALGAEPKAAFLDNPGFPSDHALFVAAITLVVACTVRNRRLVVLLVALSLLVGLGRVLALVHAPIDVVGGFAAALIGVIPWYLRTGKHKSYRNKVFAKQSS